MGAVGFFVAFGLIAVGVAAWAWLAGRKKSKGDSTANDRAEAEELHARVPTSSIPR